jgi:hypothetical protein
MIKLTKADAPDPYSILQGKKDKVLDKIIAGMNAEKQEIEQLWILNGCKMDIKRFKEQDAPYTRYGDWMLSKIV